MCVYLCVYVCVFVHMNTHFPQGWHSYLPSLTEAL